MTQPDVAADRVAAIKRLFPAKFTDTIIDVLEEEIRGRMLGVGTLLDPCVGVGGIHELAERMPGLYTVGVDIEEEFAACHERSVHGDSTTLGVPGATARTRLERVLDGRKVNAVGVSFPYGNRLCLAAGTLVTTPEGQIPIEDVQPGALVLTHRGRWRRVTWAGSTGVKSVVTVEGGGGVRSPALLIIGFGRSGRSVSSNEGCTRSDGGKHRTSPQTPMASPRHGSLTGRHTPLTGRTGIPSVLSPRRV